MSDAATDRLQQGDIAVCDACQRARPIQTEVVELFGLPVAFGPAGDTDMFVGTDDGGVLCYWCLPGGDP